ncbi:MAG: aryl-sulfate sulfotransferase [Alphaproteobacteria bacterium]|nr:aryl-sulfate sulfotransferase [Alphaproteobacteria bacterium]MCB9695624.1 aryl-sulfate sulfotransferase [Alphaproteobacteria bacterium]
MLLGIALVACSGGSDAETDTTSPTDLTHETGAPTGETATTPAGCRVDDDLKVRCPFSRSEPGALELVLELPVDGTTRSFAGEPTALTGELVGWDVVAGEDVFASVLDHGVVVDSALLSVPVPPSADIVVTVEVDGPSVVDRVAFPFACSGDPQLMALDARGRVRWLQPSGGGTQVMPTFATSGRGGVVAVTSREALREWRWDGTQVLDLELADGTLPRLVHHALDTSGEETFVLDADSQTLSDAEDYIIDGVTHISGGQASHVWDILDVMDPVGLPGPAGPSYWFQFLGSRDTVHVNSIDVQPDGTWILSLKHLDTVVKVGRNGQVLWSLLGTPTPLAFQAEALTLTSDKLDPTFQYPHHASTTPWGTLLLIDNGRGSQTTRILEFAIDEGAREATPLRAWDLGMECPVQGSAFGMPDHSVLALCARTRTLFELDDEGIRRQMSITCREDGGGPAIARAYPTNLTD